MKPRSRAPVHTAGSASWSDEIPPQASRKSPALDLLHRGRAGGVIGRHEIDQSPRASASQSRSRFSRERMGGAHLKATAPSGISSAAKVR